VAGNIGLRAVHRLHQLTDVLLAVEQRLQQPQAHRLGQHGKTPRHQLQRGFGQRTLFSHAREGNTA